MIDRKTKRQIKGTLGCEILFASSYFCMTSLLGVVNPNYTVFEMITGGAPFLVIGSIAIIGFSVGLHLLSP